VIVDLAIARCVRQPSPWDALGLELAALVLTMTLNDATQADIDHRIASMVAEAERWFPAVA
jgi:hypothetical protein